MRGSSLVRQDDNGCEGAQGVAAAKPPTWIGRNDGDRAAEVEEEAGRRATDKVGIGRQW